MLPLSSQIPGSGTFHISAGPRLLTTQQPHGIPPSISSRHYRRCYSPAGSSDDFYGDESPPYRPLSPLGRAATRATNAEGPRGIDRTGRRVQSESCATTYRSHDDNFLANLAAIKLLSGCMARSEGLISTRRPSCGIGCDGISCALEAFHLQMLSKVVSQYPPRPLTMLLDRTTLHGGTDGYVSLDSTDGFRAHAHCLAAPTTPLAFREQFSSEDLDRRLKSIDNALRRDSFPTGSSDKRLHTSEVSRKEQSHTAEDTADVDHPRNDHENFESSAKNTSRGILGALRSLQRNDRSRRSVAMFPSLDSSEMPSQRDALSVVQQTGQRSLLEDRSNMVMPQSLRDRISKRLQARSLSSRYGDFTFDPSPRRRRNERYSSVYMSSAESTPLFNAPAPSQDQMLVDTKSQPVSWKSAIDPLATASLMLATVELDRLTNRRVPDRSSEVLGSGQSSGCGGPPSSPTPKSMAPGEERSLRLNTTSCASETSTAPRKTLAPAITMRSGNSVSQSTAHGSRRQRKTSSRFSDIRTPENILEASDEDVSPATCTPGEMRTPPSLDPGEQPLPSSLASPIRMVEYSCAEALEPGLGAVLVGRDTEQTHLSQNDPLNGYWATTNARHGNTPEVHREMLLKECGGSQTRKSPTNHVHAGALTPNNTRGLWCPSRKSPSPPRRQTVWDPDTPNSHSNE